MRKSTEQVILGAFALDDSIEPQVAKNALAVLRVGSTSTTTDDDRGIDGETAAAMLGVSRRTVTNYADAGLIWRIGGKATKTRARISMRSIREYLNGNKDAA